MVKIVNSSLMIIKSQDVQCLQSFQYPLMVPMHSDSLPSYSKSEKETAYIYRPNLQETALYWLDKQMHTAL